MEMWLSQAVITRSKTQEEEIEAIKKVINYVLDFQPIERMEYADYVKDRLRHKLNKHVEYWFDESSQWRRLKSIDVDRETWVDIYRIDDIDTIEIEDEDGKVRYYDIFIEGIVMGVSSPGGSVYIMTNCKLKDVKPQEEEEEE